MLNYWVNGENRVKNQVFCGVAGVVASGESAAASGEKGKKRGFLRPAKKTPKFALALRCKFV